MLILLVFGAVSLVFAQPSEQQLARWLKRFPAADADKDGRLTVEEAEAYRQKLQAPGQEQPANQYGGEIGLGAPPEPNIDAGWQAERFPDHAVCYLSPREIADLYAKVRTGGREAVTSYPKPADGSLRIVGTGHSFMAPGYQALTAVARGAGLAQPPLCLHTGGGVTGSARYKWEQENGIFQFDRKPVPKLLASIANAEWDVMMWGPYYHDRPEYYRCWIDFCLKYNPGMKFYLMDGWPQIDQLPRRPTSDEAFTESLIAKMGELKQESFTKNVRVLEKEYPDKVFILPTCDAMVLAAQHQIRGELPGVEGVHQLAGGKQRSLWRDRIGHLGPGFGNLEGYVFYATLYGRSPELLEGDINFGDGDFGDGDYPSRELDRVFRKIAWQAVINNPRSGVTDNNGDGVDDDRE
ncbi:MAG: hypothetical protein RIC55_16190 [Pirellulaceae bacterium]